MRIPIIEEIKNAIGLRINSPLHKGSKQDYIFIHINKTAGTSVVDIIGKPFRKHLTAKEVIKVVGKKKWKNAYKFTVVRNPWDKVVSHYKHNIKVNPKRMTENNEVVTFKKWIHSTLGETKIKKYYNRPQHFLPQVDWLKNHDGIIDMDKIIRFENLNQGFNEVSEALELGQKLPHLNKTRKTTYSDFYDKETRQIVADWFHEDIQKFGYEF
tara:strand:- start:138165 stop:138800 length:636 start_codon:yes stop_codon:yes gene_type:complete